MDKVSIYFRQIIVPSLLCVGPLQRKRTLAEWMFAFLTNSIRGQFDSEKGTDKRRSLVLRNSKIAIVGRVSINSDQIDSIF